MNSFMKFLAVALVLMTGGAVAQLPPSGGLSIGNTPIQFGTPSDCLYVGSGGKLAQQACGAGTAADITVGTTTVTGAANGDILTRGASALGKLTPGTGVNTALGVNVGSAGSFVVNGGALGTPSSGVATNLTGTAAGLTAGTVTTNANLTGPITSTGNATAVASQTGTGTTFAMSIGPTLTGPIIDSVAFASLPAAASSTRRLYHVSNIGGASGIFMSSNGTRWRAFNGWALVGSIDAESTPTTNTTPGIKLQITFPAGSLLPGDRVRLLWTQRKSGTTDTAATNIYVGTAGTTADAVIYSQTTLAAAQQQGGFQMDIRLHTDTTMGPMPTTSGSGTGSSYPAVNNAAAAATVAVPSAAANALIVSVAILTSGASNSTTIWDAQAYLINSGN